MLAGYAWNGLSRLVVEDFQQPAVRLDYYRLPDATATAGTYKGLDRFGRTAPRRGGPTTPAGASASNWPTATTRGGEYNSNRTYRQNVLAGATNKYDELYAHDDLNRLVDFKRGNLNQGNSDIPTDSGGRRRQEHWTLSDTGNWSAYKVDADGDGSYTGTGDLNQSRTHNAANEI